MVVISESVDKILINTGNILSLNDITKKPGQNPTEELCEAIKITLGEADNVEGAHNLFLCRRHDDLDDKMAAHERNDLKIGIKLFVNTDCADVLNDAVQNVFGTLKIDSIENLILAYNYKPDDGGEQRLQRLQNLWRALELLVRAKKIMQIGLSDIEEATFRAVYQWAQVKPSIIQINLATCCVVPPTLQTFCKENEVQLLTHSDPSEILPRNSLREIFEDDLGVNWALRFQVHVKCRGVLTTKGYLINLSRQ